MAYQPSVTVSWVFIDEDESLARELLRLAALLERQGVVQNRVMNVAISSEARSVQVMPTEAHSFGAGIVVFLLSPAAVESAAWNRWLQHALLDRRTRVVLV